MKQEEMAKMGITRSCHMVCEHCLKDEIIHGDIKSIIEQMDAMGWICEPNEDDSDVLYFCPDCKVNIYPELFG